MPTLELPPVPEADALRVSGADDGFAVVLARLCELPYWEEDGDYTRPTEHSYKLACAILNEARTALRSPFPRASFSTSEAGAIRAYWRKPGFLVQLVLPAEKGGAGYIHVLRGSAPEVSHDLTGKKLAETLDEFHGHV